MIDCKFTKEELQLMMAALKIAVNFDPYGLKDFFNTHKDENSDDLNTAEDIIAYVNDLRGNIRGVIRNSN